MTEKWFIRSTDEFQKNVIRLSNLPHPKRRGCNFSPKFRLQLTPHYFRLIKKTYKSNASNEFRGFGCQVLHVGSAVQLRPGVSEDLELVIQASDGTFRKSLRCHCIKSRLELLRNKKVINDTVLNVECFLTSFIGMFCMMSFKSLI